MNNFTPHAPYYLYFPVYFGVTFVELDPEVIVSSLHQPVRLGKMHETELLTKATCRLEVGTCAHWMHSRVMVLSNLTGCQSAVSPIYSFLHTIT